MKLKDKIYDYLNAGIRQTLPKALTEAFGDLNFKTEWNLFAMNLQTFWEKTTTKYQNTKIRIFTRGYEKGYMDAMKLVRKFN